MPIYEYACGKCKARFELMRPFSKSEEGAICPRCQGKAKRAISACFSMSKSSSGATTSIAGSGSSCGSCGGGSCGSCGH